MKFLPAIAVIAAVLLSGPTHAGKSAWDEINESLEGSNKITVYRNPSCGCCEKWVEHLEKHGFEVEAVPSQNMNLVKAEHGIPRHLASCHTAVIDGYVIEGHVPAEDIKKLLNEKPDIAGIAVPAMPVGSPGMEAGDRKDPFYVISFRKTGESGIFKSYRSY